MAKHNEIIDNCLFYRGEFGNSKDAYIDIKPIDHTCIEVSQIVTYILLKGLFDIGMTTFY